MLEELIEKLIKEALAIRPELFLIDLSILENNQIRVVIDGDNGVSVDDCIFLSRAIEHNLDRDKEDFSLEVTSAGVTSLLQFKRQYKKNIGRILFVKTLAEEFEGKLSDVKDDGILIEWKAREPKPVGKGKRTVQKKEKILYKDIVKAKVMIKF